MKRQFGLLAVCALALALMPTLEVQAQKKQVDVTKSWKGSVADEALQKAGSEVVTNAKDLEKLWKAWSIEGDAPKVDFTKELVVVTMSRGSQISLMPMLDDKGNLQILGKGTLDLRPGFRYVIGTISREGVKTVNKKELPKD